MAAASKMTIDELLQAEKPATSFKPSAYFGEEDDALYVHFTNEPDCRKRLNERVTLYLSMDLQRIVGCQIKGIRGIMEDLPYFVVAKHGKEKLQLAFVALLSSFDDEDDRHAFREAGQALANSEGLELVGCGG